MQKSSLIIALIGLGLMPPAFATKVGFSPAPTARTVVNSSAVQLATSSLVWVGNFSSTTFSLNNALTLQQNVTAIQATGGWEQFGIDTSTGVPNSGLVTSLGISPLGKLGGTVEDTNFGSTKADYFNAKSLYVWIFNAPTVATASEMGIYRAPSASTPWVFPTNAGGIGDIETALSTLPATSISSFGGVGSTSSSQLILTEITPIPEPSTFTAGALLGLVAVGVRRRRRP